VTDVVATSYATVDPGTLSGPSPPASSVPSGSVSIKLESESRPGKPTALLKSRTIVRVPENEASADSASSVYVTSTAGPMYGVLLRSRRLGSTVTRCDSPSVASAASVSLTLGGVPGVPGT